MADLKIQTLIEILTKGKGGEDAVKVLRQLETESRKTRKSMGDTGKASTGLSKDLGVLAKSAATIKTAFAGIGIGLGAAAITGFVTSAVAGFAKTERSMNALRFQIRGLKGDYEDNVDSAEKFIDSLQTQTGILDDDLIPALSHALAVMGDLAQAEQTVAIAAKFAANGFGTVESNVDALTRAFQTNSVKSLKAFNIELKDASGKSIDLAEAIRRVEEASGKLPDKLNDLQGRLDSLKVLWDTFSDSLVGSLDRIAERLLNSTNKFRDFFTQMAAGVLFQATKGPTGFVEGIKRASEALREEQAKAEKAAEAAFIGPRPESALAKKARETASAAAAIKATEDATKAAEEYKKTLEKVKEAQAEAGLDLTGVAAPVQGPELPPTQLLREFPIPEEPEREAALGGDDVLRQMKERNALAEQHLDILNLESEAYASMIEPFDSLTAATDHVMETQARLIEQGGEWTDVLQEQSKAMLRNSARAEAMAAAQGILKDSLYLVADALWNAAVTGDLSMKALVQAVAKEAFGVLTALAIENLFRGMTEAALAVGSAASGNFAGAALHATAAKMHYHAAGAAAVGAGAALAVGAATADKTQGGGFDVPQHDRMAEVGGLRWSKDMVRNFTTGAFRGMSAGWERGMLGAGGGAGGGGSTTSISNDYADRSSVQVDVHVGTLIGRRGERHLARAVKRAVVRDGARGLR